MRIRYYTTYVEQDKSFILWNYVIVKGYLVLTQQIFYRWATKVKKKIHHQPLKFTRIFSLARQITLVRFKIPKLVSHCVIWIPFADMKKLVWYTHLKHVKSYLDDLFYFLHLISHFQPPFFIFQNSLFHDEWRCRAI